MRRVLLIAALLWPASGFAQPLERMIEDRARQNYSAAIPDGAVVKVTLKSAPARDPVLLSDFWMDPASGRFLTNAVYESGDMQRLSGLALVTVPVPVAIRRLMPGEIVAAADLRIEKMPLANVGALSVRDPDDLVGKQVRRILAEGRPVQARSVSEPLIIDRGDEVEIRFRDGALALTAPGRALADARTGQDIRIVNLVSNKTITGRATADGIVEVGP